MEQDTPGMAQYRQSKFLDFVNEMASRPTEAESKKYTSEVDNEIANAEARGMADYYAGMRQAQAEMNAGRTPQSVDENQVDAGFIPMEKPAVNQYQNQIMAGLTPPSNNRLPSTQASQVATQTAIPQRMMEANRAMGQGPDVFGGHAQAQEPSSQETIDRMMKVTGSDLRPISAQKNPEEAYDKARLSGLEEVKNEHVEAINKTVSEAPFMSKSKDFGDLTGAWEKAYSDLAMAVQNKDEALAKQKASEADNIMARINQLGELERNASDKFKKDMDAIDAEVNKTRLWDNMPVGNKLIAAISLFAGAFTRDGQNRALSTLNAEINKDIQNQKIEYDRKGDKAKNAYAIAAKFYAGEKERLAMAHAITNESLAAKAMELESSIQPQKTKEAIERFKLQLKLSAQSNTSKAYKDYLDMRKAELDIVGKKQEIQDKESAKTVIGAGKALTPKGAEELGLATSKTVDALKVASGLQDTLSKVSRVGQFFTPYDKNRLSLEIQGIITTLKEAQQSAPGMRLPVSEVNKLSTIYENMSDRTKLAFYGPKFFIDEVERIKDEMKESLKQHYEQQGLQIPAHLIKNQTQAQAR